MTKFPVMNLRVHAQTIAFNKSLLTENNGPIYLEKAQDMR